jgi:hypothetical protein
MPATTTRTLAALKNSSGLAQTRFIAPAFPSAPALKPTVAPSSHRHYSRTCTCQLLSRKHPALAPTQKSSYSPLHLSSSANIASQRTEAIQRHLSTAADNPSSTMSYGKGSSEFSARQIAPKNTLDYRCYLEQNGKPVSPFHDIPLYANDAQTILNMIVEIPRWSNAKLEVSKMIETKDTTHTYLDLQGGVPQPYQAGRQEGQASLRAQLLPPQGLPLELWCLPQSKLAV